MKRKSFLLAFLFVCCCLQAQPKVSHYVFAPFHLEDYEKSVVVDEARLRVSYALNADDLSDTGTYVDLEYLLVGDSVSRYYSAFLNYRDSSLVEWEKAHPKADSSPIWLGEGGKRKDCWSEYQYSDIFKEGKEITVYSRMPRALERFDCWHKEAYPLQQWDIQSDTLTVCGYVCQKAVCHFRGRSFEAWFAPDIPVSLGPWKFGGLPGLILKLYDVDRLYRFECVNIEQGKFPIKKYHYSQYKPVKRSRLLKLQRKINENYLSIVSVNLSFYTPYDPLELE